jgi:malate dehydrogenase (oxaloacetate-decarboxylating)
VARQIALGLQRDGLGAAAAAGRIYMIDSRGLILRNRKDLEPYKLEFAQDPGRVAGWRVEGQIPSLLETVRQARVTALLGLSGQRGAFGEEVVRAVDANTPYPTIFALSNPTANSEAVPEDIYRWTEGRAIVATGSPFKDVAFDGLLRPVGQGNNVFIFPGVGLGVILSGATRVTGTMFTAAAEALAVYVDPMRLEHGGVYPRIEQLRGASKRVAMAVIEQARADGVMTNSVPEAGLEGFVESRMWRPEYLPIKKGVGGRDSGLG